MKNFGKFGCFAMLLASSAIHAQTANNNINLLNRNFISNDALVAANGPATPQAPSTTTMPAAPTAATPAAGEVTKKTVPASVQQILDKLNAGKAPSVANAAPAAQVASPAPAAAPAAPIQRYIPDTDNNSARIDFYQAKGDQKNGYFAQKYAQPALVLPSASSNAKQLEILQPYILQLRKAGIEEGKISVELNRLTPAQFANWAQQVSY